MTLYRYQPLRRGFQAPRSCPSEWKLRVGRRRPFQASGATSVRPFGQGATDHGGSHAHQTHSTLSYLCLLYGTGTECTDVERYRTGTQNSVGKRLVHRVQYECTDVNMYRNGTPYKACIRLVHGLRWDVCTGLVHSAMHVSVWYIFYNRMYVLNSYTMSCMLRTGTSCTLLCMYWTPTPCHPCKEWYIFYDRMHVPISYAVQHMYRTGTFCTVVSMYWTLTQCHACKRLVLRWGR